MTGVTTTSTVVTGLTNDKFYYFKVAAVNGGGPGALSNEAAAYTSAPSHGNPNGMSFPAGLALFSVPYDYPGEPLDTLFGYDGVKLAVWQPAEGIYALTPAPAADAIRLGVGYWARFPSAVTLLYNGAPAPTNKSFDIALPEGWSQIGDPFTKVVPLTSLTFANGSLTFAQASAGSDAVIRPAVYGYDATLNSGAGGYTLTNTLAPGKGYWICALSSTDVEVPVP
jgi:hypothetical protein